MFSWLFWKKRIDGNLRRLSFHFTINEDIAWTQHDGESKFIAISSCWGRQVHERGGDQREVSDRGWQGQHREDRDWGQQPADRQVQLLSCQLSAQLLSCKISYSAVCWQTSASIELLSRSAVCEWTIYTKLCLYNLMSIMIVCIYCTLLCNTSFCSNGCFVVMNCVPFWFRRSKSLYFIPYDNINFAHQKYNKYSKSKWQSASCDPANHF